MDSYKEKGYANRDEYLEELADETGYPVAVVEELANVLGESEDFDGLVSVLEDGGDF